MFGSVLSADLTHRCKPWTRGLQSKLRSWPKRDALLWNSMLVLLVFSGTAFNMAYMWHGNGLKSVMLGDFHWFRSWLKSFVHILPLPMAVRWTFENRKHTNLCTRAGNWWQLTNTWLIGWTSGVNVLKVLCMPGVKVGLQVSPPTTHRNTLRGFGRPSIMNSHFPCCGGNCRDKHACWHVSGRVLGVTATIFMIISVTWLVVVVPKLLKTAKTPARNRRTRLNTSAEKWKTRKSSANCISFTRQLVTVVPVTCSQRWKGEGLTNTSLNLRKILFAPCVRKNKSSTPNMWRRWNPSLQNWVR